MFIYSLFELEISWNFDSGHDVICDVINFLDFDRKVKFWFVLESKSIDFTGVLLDWCVVNRCVLMCYLLIKYGVFGWVREKLYFSRCWWDFRVDSGDFWWCEKWWNAWFFNVLSKWVSNSKWWKTCGNIRYALSSNRTFVQKCKLRPHHGVKHTIIVQYYSIFLLNRCLICYSWSVTLINYMHKYFSTLKRYSIKVVRFWHRKIL